MKKWILIGILVLAISAIAASRINNAGLEIFNPSNSSDTITYIHLRQSTNSYDTISNYIDSDIFYNSENYPKITTTRNVQSGTSFIYESSYMEADPLGSLGGTDYYYIIQINGHTFWSIYGDESEINNEVDLIGLFETTNLTITSSAGSGNAHACLDASGTLFRGNASCDPI